jgi:hypothetical protein
VGVENSDPAAAAAAAAAGHWLSKVLICDLHPTHPAPAVQCLKLASTFCTVLLHNKNIKMDGLVKAWCTFHYFSNSGIHLFFSVIFSVLQIFFSSLL